MFSFNHINSDIPTQLASEIDLLSIVLATIAMVSFQFAVLTSLRRRNRRHRCESELAEYHFISTEIVALLPFGPRRWTYEDIATPALAISVGLFFASLGLFAIPRGVLLIPALGLFFVLVGANVSFGGLVRIKTKYVSTAEMISNDYGLGRQRY